MEYNFTSIEPKWQQFWEQNQTYKTDNESTKPKYYILDMFPYPSGDGLHIGHPLGYTASDIISRYKRLNGFNVLHPIGFDAYGLPAEQYAIQTGQHPEVTTLKNITAFTQQLKALGYDYDWTREISTCSPDFYKYTQLIFLHLFDAWFNKTLEKAQSICTLIKHLEQQGNKNINAACDDDTPSFSAAEWNSFDDLEKQNILMKYRLAYQKYGEIWYCSALGSVLANDEVKDGVSERGGYPVERIKMKQWFLRITAYANRLLNDLDSLEWSDSLKEMQRNWIGKSEGALIHFKLIEKNTPEHHQQSILVFTTRPDTIFGVTFLVIAPEHDLVNLITTAEQQQAINEYTAYTKNRSERDRMAEVKTVTGCFTGAFCEHPFTKQPIPVYISDYVLAGYGTGAIMAVPSSDERDLRFAKHFNIPIIYIIENTENLENPTEKKRGITINSEFLNGLDTDKAISMAVKKIEELGIGKGKINFKMRDAGFSRQRYWGEPFPIIYSPTGIIHTVPENELPLELPQVQSYLPTGTGQSPLANVSEWLNLPNNFTRETDTMPGYAGSSWYYLRYMDNKNTNEPFSKKAEQYWQNVDFYLGGDEHAVGHLLYSRMWHKFLFDIEKVSTHEPFKKLVNQGKIQGRSCLVYRIKDSNTFVSYNLKNQYNTSELYVHIDLVGANDVLNINAFKQWRSDFANATFILEPDNTYICGTAIEKMSKSKHNVVNPNKVISDYGADCLRMYIMFLGPLEMAKPWDTKGIEGVSRFLKKFWRLFNIDENGLAQLNNAEPTAEELKILHRTIKKISEDIERVSLNTCVSTFMVCINELADVKCNKTAILQTLCQLLAPFAPHITEEIWHALGNSNSIHTTKYPVYNPNYLIENAFEYPIQINGKLRAKITLPLNFDALQAEIAVLANDALKQWLEGNTIKKFTYVKGRIISIAL